jgi:hypothetical protein
VLLRHTGVKTAIGASVAREGERGMPEWDEEKQGLHREISGLGKALSEGHVEWDQ